MTLVLAAAGTAAVLVAVGVALVLLRAVSGEPTGHPVAPATTVAPLTLPASVVAGSSLDITASGLPGDAATVVAQASVGTWTAATAVDEGRVTVALPDHLLVRAGVLVVEVRAGDVAVRGATEITPGPTVSPLQLVVGARSITADARTWAMGVALPEDALGNPPAEGTPATITVEHPDGVREALATEVRGLLVHDRIWSRTLAGRTRIALVVDGIAAPEAELEEVPGPPIDVPLEVDPVVLVADGRDLVTVRTTRLVDEHGNEVADGTEVTFTVRGPGGDLRLASAPSVNGVAEVPVEAPALAGEVEIRARVLGVTGPALLLTFAADLAQDHEVRLVDDTVRVGPVRSRLGQLAPDGTPVRVRWLRADGRAAERRVQLLEGRVEVVLGPHDPTSVTVAVGEGGPWREVRP